MACSAGIAENSPAWSTFSMDVSNVHLRSIDRSAVAFDSLCTSFVEKHACLVACAVLQNTDVMSSDQCGVAGRVRSMHVSALDAVRQQTDHAKRREHPSNELLLSEECGCSFQTCSTFQRKVQRLVTGKCSWPHLAFPAPRVESCCMVLVLLP